MITGPFESFRRKIDRVFDNFGMSLRWPFGWTAPDIDGWAWLVDTARLVCGNSQIKWDGLQVPKMTRRKRIMATAK
jgi:hypothetical protein